MKSKVSSLVLRARAVKRKIIKALEEIPEGLTITDLVNVTKLSRSAVLIELAKMEGASSVNVRRVGMAKIYSLVDENGRGE